MDIVIPFRRSRNKDEELRYVLRSVSKHVAGHSKVYIIGDSPRWSYKNLVIVGVKNGSGSIEKWHEKNIAQKLLLACRIPELSEDFLYHDDDEYLLQQFDGSYYHKGSVWDGNGNYAKTENNTQEFLIRRGHLEVINNFNVHCPRVFNKNKLARILEILDWRKPYGYQINTCYAVMNFIEGVCIEDIKFKSALPFELLMKRFGMNKRFFTLQDRAWNKAAVKLLNSLFPEKSIYEN